MSSPNGQRLRRRVWLDTDMGFDDLAAVLMLQHAANVEIAGMSLCAGNAPLPVVRRSAALAAACFGWAFPITAGAGAALNGSSVTAQSVLGEDAMRSAGLGLGDVVKTELAEIADAEFPLAELAESAESVEVLALGPLTNLARWMQAPASRQRIASITWMGGSAGPGNHTAAAEFNAFVDPEAAQIVIAEAAKVGIPFKMVGLDACRQVRVRAADAANLRAIGTQKAALLADLLLGYVRIPDPSGQSPMSVYDPTAAALWLQPELTTWRPACVDVELVGHHTRGMTVCEFRVPRKAQANAEVAGAVDEAAVRAMVLAALAAASS